MPKGGVIGPVRELNPGPLAPKARIMPLDQQAGDIKYVLGGVFYSLLLLKRVDLHLRHDSVMNRLVLLLF